MADKKPVSRARAAGGRRRSDDGSDDAELAAAVLVGGETRESFQAVLDEHRKRFGELDEVEDALVGDAATLWWRLRRAVAIEGSWIDEELEREPEGDERARIAKAFGRLAETKKMRFMLEYQARLAKMYREAMKAAREMQARRCAELCPKPDPTRRW